MFTNYNKRSYDIGELVEYNLALGSMGGYIHVAHKFGITDFEFDHEKFNFPRITKKSLIMRKSFLRTYPNSHAIIEENCIAFFIDPVFRSPQANDNGEWLVLRNSNAIRYYVSSKTFEFIVEKENENGKKYSTLVKTNDLFEAYIYFEKYFKGYENDLKWYLNYCNINLNTA